MPIRCSLRPYPLGDDPTAYSAATRPSRTVDLDGLLDRATGSGSSVSRADALAVLAAVDEAIVSLLREGAHVSLPLASYGTRVRGTFDGPGDRFDTARHRVLPTVRPGAALRRAFQGRVSVEKVAGSRPVPTPTAYLDHNTGQRNGPLMPGGMGELRGLRLKLDPADPEQGVFVVSAATGEAVRASVVARAVPSSVLFQVPHDLAAGTYRLAVRARFRDHLRTGRLDPPLQVGP